MKQARLLVNPEAGRGKAHRKLPELQSALMSRGVESTVIESRSAGHLTELAREASRESGTIVVVCGGDGTLNHVVQGIDLRSTTIAVAPLGSGNDFASVLGMPRSIEPIADVIARGETRAVDVGLANDRRFVGVAALGFDALVAREAEKVRFLRGSAIYLWAVFRVLSRFKPKQIAWGVDGVDRSGPLMLVAVGNTDRYGGGVRIAPGAEPDDGVFDACVVHGCSLPELFRMLPRAYRGRHVESRFVEMVRGRRLRFESDETLEVFADGELVATTPVEISFAAETLRVIAP